MKQFVLILLLLSSVAFSANSAQSNSNNDGNFGEYKYSKYLGIQQQIRTQQMAAARRQRIYNQNPTRNIRYSRYPGQYPNIERNYYSGYKAPNRYSSQYYKMRYGY